MICPIDRCLSEHQCMFTGRILMEREPDCEHYKLTGGKITAKIIILKNPVAFYRSSCTSTNNSFIFQVGTEVFCMSSQCL